ncbi:ABC transporter ATP-binding protein [bacterium]|nr:ABC transporter ATP-binding protein [bacterium]
MIILEHLSKCYGPVQAVTELNLKIPKGQLFGFLGPNGAGKTTTIKILAGLLEPSQGTVTIAGFNLKTHPEQAKRLTGYIPDKPFLYDKLTGREFLEFIARLYQLNVPALSARIEYYLELFQLKDWGDELIESYSHGMKQKIVMSSALLHDPQVLIVDEPMVGLDPEGALLVKKLFKDLTRQGVTIFMSTHTLAIAQQLCDRIAIIKKGVIIADGSIDELKKLVKTGVEELEDIFLELTQDQAQVQLAEILSIKKP